jgi:hypothetical protein
VYRNITSTFASNWCKTWTLILREKTWAESVRKQVAGEIFGPERDEVTGDWSKLRNEGLHDLYSWPYVVDQGRRNGESTWHVWGVQKCYSVLIGKP